MVSWLTILLSWQFKALRDRVPENKMDWAPNIIALFLAKIN
jgi:hypothetical protein